MTEEMIFRTHLVQSMYELIKGADFAEIMSKMEKPDIGGLTGLIMKSAVQAVAPSLPKYLHKLDANPDAQRNLAAIMRHLVTEADKDESENILTTLESELAKVDRYIDKEAEKESHDDGEFEDRGEGKNTDGPDDSGAGGGTAGDGDTAENESAASPTATDESRGGDDTRAREEGAISDD